MTSHSQKDSAFEYSDNGIVITRTRRKAVVAYPDTENSRDQHVIVEYPVSNQVEDVTVGDEVIVEGDRTGGLIKEIKPRKNCLFRSFGKKRKNICSNLDLALIVSAPGSLGNTVFIDRVLAATYLNDIPLALVINKEDVEDPSDLLEIYSPLSITLLTTSTKTEDGLNSLKKIIDSPELQSVVLCGISGVGKSSIINRLVPNAERRTQGLSRKTGQGQQTTTQSYGFFMSREDAPPLLLVDTPGVQNFGLSHLKAEELRLSFEEFVRLGTTCKYRDCMHVDEEESECAVIAGLESGDIHPSRYNSYLNILAEIDYAERTRYS